MCITVRGKDGREYGFPFKGDPDHLAEWRANGLEIDEVLNTVPEWAVDLGLTLRITGRPTAARRWTVRVDAVVRPHD